MVHYFSYQISLYTIRLSIDFFSMYSYQLALTICLMQISIFTTINMDN